MTDETDRCDRCGKPAPLGFEILDWHSLRHPDRVRCPACVKEFDPRFDWGDEDEDPGDLVRLADGSYGVSPRTRELAPVGVDAMRQQAATAEPARASRRAGSVRAEQRVREEFGGVARDEREQHDDLAVIEWAVGRDAMTVNPEPVSRLEDRGADARAVADAQRWLRENDPALAVPEELRTVAGVTTAVKKEAAARGENVKRCRAVFLKRRGRPSATLKAHRASVRSQRGDGKRRRWVAALQVQHDANLLKQQQRRHVRAGGLLTQRLKQGGTLPERKVLTGRSQGKPSIRKADAIRCIAFFEHLVDVTAHAARTSTR